MTFRRARGNWPVFPLALEGFQIVTAWRPDPTREMARSFVELWYAEQHNLRVFYGDAPGEWSKGAALAAALEGANRLADGLIVADADVLVAPQALADACAAVRDGAAWAMPHAMVHRLSRRGTMLVYRGEVMGEYPPPSWLERRPHPAPPGGGIVVTTRAAWEAAPMDPRFVGWGGDDISWARALDTLVGPGRKGDAPMWHLWHRPDRTRLKGGRGSVANEALAARYMLAEGDREAMEVLAHECVGGGPALGTVG